MTDSRKGSGNPGAPPDVGAVRNAGRRRWLQAGISTAPVVMTVASRPVLAAIECRTPSGFVSGFASGAPAGVCGGGNPTYWVTHRPWPSPYNPGPGGGTPSRFNYYFDPDLSMGAGPTFVEVLGLTGTLQSYIVAALLNNAQLLVPESILPKATIMAMWTQVNAGGFGLGIPGSGLWNAAQVIAYLQSTMIDLVP